VLTLVLGGARSGKSAHAQSLVSGTVVYVATAPADANDPEMVARIARHRAGRPAGWKTIEAPLDLVGAVRGAEPKDASILVDCVTLWVSNLVYEHRRLDGTARESLILGAATAFGDLGRAREIVAVTNEVGSGLVPETEVGREFRDLQGRVNQILAGAASRVVLMAAGIPLAIKS
jgi:adenosylcobinamide kinase/adenosylcobinamide-phosphate guanylyltransferase